ncbi:pyridoxal-phosphate-dependent aminotransferase family protein [Virgibacillus halodenitrificans]|uniref:pyridoxal-phosphate-dependent aminotransferase family protein n=1 Tax=Virgibacillus halodenitrificans TaxID=1482 RepID=UPI002DBB86E9|nr:alanine--glyoxylate aminotransferase family protein [Virgibacillus halodenitrificans]MEC2158088.1 alanine--glyoxylate aminotransferase family protein [Virgibacillus halodenitrificans]
MLAEQTILRIPGPTPIPPSVNRAMNQPMIGHRDQETKSLIESIKPRLKPIFGTAQEIMVLAGSGTAGLETAVVNTVQPGDEVLVIITGAFGERFAKICQEYNITTHLHDVRWGNAAEAQAVSELLKKHPSIKAVFATYCETSTGVLNPVKDIAEAVHTNSDALFIVDGVSCVGAVETKMDEWGIDVLVTGSQKAMMLPPGLTFIAASKRAWKVIEKNKQPRFYFNLQKYRDNLENNSTPFTPAVSLLFGLEQVLQLLESETLEKVYQRHQVMMNMTRAAFKAMNIPLLTSDPAASPTVTAIKPEDFNPEDLRNIIKQDFKMTVAGGQQHLKGEIFRVGHMGYCSPADVLQSISLIEIGIKKIGKDITLGRGIQAAQEVYIQQL